MTIWRNSEPWSAIIARFAAMIIMSVAALALIGWARDILLLRSFGQTVPMNPMTAVAFLAAGVSLSLQREMGVRRWKRVGPALAFFIVLTGLLKTCDYWFDWQWAPDQILFASKLNGNQMAPNTAICFVMLGLGLLFIDTRIRGYHITPALLIGVTAVSLAGLFGYVYTMLWLFSVADFTPMALNTAIAFMVISVGALCARPRVQPMWWIARDWNVEKQMAFLFVSALVMTGFLAFTSYRGGARSIELQLQASSLDHWNHDSVQAIRLMMLTTSIGSGVALLVVLFCSWRIRRDFRARSRTEQAMQEQKALLEQILSLAPYSIFWKDRQSKYLGCNEAFARLAGLKCSADVVGKTDYNLSWSREQSHSYRQFDRDLIETGNSIVRMEERIRSADGSEYTVLTSKTPIRDAEGAITGVLCTFTDISDRKQMESDLRAAKEVAETASHTKSQFLAHMSHEIRTPLNGVIGMTDLLLATPLNSIQRHYAELVKSSGASLASLLNDILDLSKIEAGKLDVESIEFDLLNAVEDIAEVMVHKAWQKGIEIASHANADVPRLVRGDPERVKQILVNLVNNAIKFTEAGSVNIGVALLSSGFGQSKVRFEVTDTGIGIPPDRIDRLFKSFSQVDASTTRKYGGTGLGLAISRQLAELMGGEIGVHSTPGEGSTFWFTITVQTGGRRDAAPQSIDLVGTRVLAIDDNDGSREALREQIASWGMQAEIVAGGEEGLRMLAEAATEGRAYRVAIVDDDMPGMSGLEVARAIKADARLNETVLMILLSAQADFDLEMLQAAGFSGHMTKPVRQSQLFDAIVTAIAHAKSAPKRAVVEAVDQAAPAAASRGARVLLAEDNRVNQIVATEILRRNGFAFEVVDNGRKAVDAVRSQAFDLVLMDCQMPEMDGFEATTEIRRWESESGGGRRLPILALTANAIKGDRERCLQAGMDAYVAKPIDPKRLIDEIDSLLAKPGGAPAPAAAPVAAAPLSIEAVIDICMGNAGVALTVLDEFETQVTLDLQKVVVSLAAADAKETASVAHSLKGAAGLIHAEPIRRIAAELEAMGRADDLSHAERSLKQLQEEVRRCLAFLPEAKKVVTESSKAQGQGLP